MTVGIARVYDEIGKDPARCILVDRLWPRGLARSKAPFDAWAKDVAPSAELRKWYGHVPERFEEFAKPAPKHLGLERDQARARFGQREEIKKDEDD